MFKTEDFEAQLLTQEKRLTELEIENENLDEKAETFLKELNVTPLQLTTFLADENAFTKENWEELKKQKKQLDDALERELKNISKPLETKKKYSQSAQVQHHWLFVR